MATKKPLIIDGAQIKEMPASDTIGSSIQVATTDRVLGRDTSGAGAHEELTASQVLDFVGATQGQILYRGASGWAALSAGTSGHYLQTQGAGANPQWAAASGGSGPTFIYKSADETVNNSTTFQADDHLTFTLDANKKALISVYLFINNGNTAEVKVRLVATGATTVRFAGTGAVHDYSYTFNQDGTGGSVRTQETNGATVEYGFIHAHGFVDAGASSRTVTVEWAQLTATAKNTTIQSGSWMMYQTMD